MSCTYSWLVVGIVLFIIVFLFLFSMRLLLLHICWVVALKSGRSRPWLHRSCIHPYTWEFACGLLLVFCFLSCFCCYFIFLYTLFDLFLGIELTARAVFAILCVAIFMSNTIAHTHAIIIYVNVYICAVVCALLRCICGRFYKLHCFFFTFFFYIFLLFLFFCNKSAQDIEVYTLGNDWWLRQRQ